MQKNGHDFPYMAAHLQALACVRADKAAMCAFRQQWTAFRMAQRLAHYGPASQKPEHQRQAQVAFKEAWKTIKPVISPLFQDCPTAVDDEVRAVAAALGQRLELQSRA